MEATWKQSDPSRDKRACPISAREVEDEVLCHPILPDNLRQPLDNMPPRRATAREESVLPTSRPSSPPDDIEEVRYQCLNSVAIGWIPILLDALLRQRRRTPTTSMIIPPESP